MKYMNHLRKLALLSSLALSFSVAVYADGTLPLPLDMNDPAAKLNLNVTSVGDTPRTPFVENGVQACNINDEAYTATGTVTLGTAAGPLEHTIVGVCKPKFDSPKRTIVTMDEQGSRFTVLDGSADNELSFRTFTGTLSHKFLVPTTGSNSPEAEPAINLKPISFRLRR